MKNQQPANEIPVYLFIGFLDSGKTRFIQETLEDPRFNAGEKTLLLVCEQGEEEYDPSRFAFPNVVIRNVDGIDEILPANLEKMRKELR